MSVSTTVRRDWWISTLLILLSLVPAIAGTARLAQLAQNGERTAANARFFAQPIPIVLHIIVVIPYCIIGAFQFSPGFRRRNRWWHRVAGRVLGVLGLLAALSGLWMAHFYPWPQGDGPVLYVERLVFGTAMAASTVLGINAVRRRDIAAHGAWMMRAYAIGLGAGTQVLTHVPWFILVGRPGESARALLMGAGWVINLVVAERIIRRSRRDHPRSGSTRVEPIHSLSVPHISQRRAHLSTTRPIRCLLALIALLLVGTPLLSRAQAASKPIVILFVGNSFFHGAFQPVLSYGNTTVTDENAAMPTGSPRSENGRGPYGGIPAIFKKLTDESGLNYEVHSELISGKSLEFHYDNALPVIDQAKWDVVIMHDFSTGPAPAARTGKPESFMKYADLLEQTIHRANKSADVYLYETWPRADLTYPDKGPYHGEPIDVMAKDIHDGYAREFAHNGHFRGLAPAGDAWMSAIHSGIAEADPYHPEAGKIDLWAVDSYHPSVYGAYLDALVVFEQITGKDARALGSHEQAATDLGIAPNMAATLQRIAHEQVHPK